MSDDLLALTSRQIELLREFYNTVGMDADLGEAVYRAIKLADYTAKKCAAPPKSGDINATENGESMGCVESERTAVRPIDTNSPFCIYPEKDVNKLVDMGKPNPSEISDDLHNELVGLISKTLPCDSYTAATVVTVIKPYLRTTEPVMSIEGGVAPSGFDPQAGSVPGKKADASSTLAPSAIAGSSNGRTADFESANDGSSPSPASKQQPVESTSCFNCGSEMGDGGCEKCAKELAVYLNDKYPTNAELAAFEDGYEMGLKVAPLKRESGNHELLTEIAAIAAMEYSLGATPSGIKSIYELLENAGWLAKEIKQIEAESSNTRPGDQKP